MHDFKLKNYQYMQKNKYYYLIKKMEVIEINATKLILIQNLFF